MNEAPIWGAEDFNETQAFCRRIQHYCARSVSATPGLGQTVFGTILGTVTDVSGAVVPNVMVTVTNQGENISREVRSDAQGNYQAENMKAGLYTVSAMATGFKDTVLSDVRFDARQTVRADMKRRRREPRRAAGAEDRVLGR